MHKCKCNDVHPSKTEKTSFTNIYMSVMSCIWIQLPECQRRPTSPRVRSPVKTSSPRRHRDKTTGTRQVLCTIYVFCSMDQTAGSSGRRRTGPRLSLVSPKVFFSVLSLMEFCFLAAVASGLLSWGHFIFSVIVRYYLNWTELDDDITEFNDELPLTENWVFTIVLLHYWHYFPIWYCKAALTQCVLLEALYK